MRYLVAIVVLTAAFLMPALTWAAETVTLTTPVTKPTQTMCKVDRITIDVTAKTLYLQVLGENGEPSTKVYDATTVPTGATLLSALNTANLTSNSLVKRIFTRLGLDGICVGIVTGTPD